MSYTPEFLIDLANSAPFLDCSEDGAAWKTFPSEDGWQVVYFYDAD
jgi:transposase